ncbi:DUF6724 family protein [Atopobium fossor]|uniref:DUF6724 family protein n=1 Tax=Atopobium fossor TaxID=39487 RepID=UPI000404A431|nr:DUF6724 family protein [Atopobium fossor]
MASIGEILNWLFHTRPGVACLLAGGVVIFAIVAFVSEKRGQKRYYNHEPTEDDGGWSLFGDLSSHDEANEKKNK